MTLLEWDVARAGGMVAFALLTLAVIAGLALSGRAQLRYWPRFAVEDVHRFLGMLTGVFIWIHVLALLFDSYMPFSLADLIVPGAAPYRPFASALGVVAAELALALAITNRYRKRLPHRFWRRAHYLNFAVWIGSFAHGLLAGSDTGALWAEVVYLGAGATIAGLVAWRILNPLPAFAGQPG